MRFSHGHLPDSQSRNSARYRCETSDWTRRSPGTRSSSFYGPTAFRELFTKYRGHASEPGAALIIPCQRQAASSARIVVCDGVPSSLKTHGTMFAFALHESGQHPKDSETRCSRMLTTPSDQLTEQEI
jgi:hypothetical protein